MCRSPAGSVGRPARSSTRTSRPLVLVPLAPSLVLHRIPADPMHRPRMNWDRRPQQVGLPTGTSDGPSARRAGGVGRRIRRGDVGPHRERGCAARRPVASADQRAVRPYPDRLAHRASGSRSVRKTRTLTTSAARPLSAVMSWNVGSAVVSLFGGRGGRAPSSAGDRRRRRCGVQLGSRRQSHQPPTRQDPKPDPLLKLDHYRRPDTPRLRGCRWRSRFPHREPVLSPERTDSHAVNFAGRAQSLKLDRKPCDLDIVRISYSS